MIEWMNLSDKLTSIIQTFPSSELGSAADDICEYGFHGTYIERRGGAVVSKNGDVLLEESTEQKADENLQENAEQNTEQIAEQNAEQRRSKPYQRASR